ncbi:MAG TPA: dihydrodipicolinate synthase family protein [Thermoanaerobaculia bacterium]|nr:dihydrodipicolinate synthase family protein [Thermoanaerobaculia bacterium]
MNWKGVIPAITTPFREDLSVDHDFLAKHASWMIENGCAAIVALGSLGEGATLEFDEKVAVVKTCLRSKAPVVASISALSTAAAVRLAKKAEEIGCSGLMVLPPYVYSTDWREMKAHIEAVLRATKLSCMLYNNPIAYRTDFLPEQVAELASEHQNLQAVKESSADVRRIAAIKAVMRRPMAIFVGVDDLIVEGIAAGAVGWIAGLVNALPKESVALFQGADIYSWFLPLLRLDTVPKFVQLIKLVQQEVGMGSEHVRPPRLTLAGDERKAALYIIRSAIASRPRV